MALMARRIPADESPEDRALREIEAEDEGALDRLVREAGPPPDARRMSEADEDEAWDTTDPSVDYDEMVRLLPSQGLPPELAQGLLYVKLHPDALEEFVTPTGSLEKAHILARLAQFPFHRSLLEDETDYAEMVKKSDRLERRRQKRLTQYQERAAFTPGPQQMGG